VQGIDGRSHQLQVPGSLRQLQSGVPLLQSGVIRGDLESEPNSQDGCPVRIENASFERAARLMLTSDREGRNAPTLHLDYRNFSGKEIDSVVLTGWIKFKDSPYQLDYAVHAFQLELSREAVLGKYAQATQALRLANDAFGVDRIELSAVNYADGTSWTAKQKSCVYRYLGTTQRAEAR
jgi:hypothetical protein